MYSWLEYVNLELFPLLREIEGQISGSFPANRNKYQYSVDSLQKVLKVIDEHLKKRTFMIGDSVTLVDIVLICFLEDIMKRVLGEGERKKVVHFMRWWNYMRKTEPVVEVLNDINLCERPVELEFEDDKIKNELPEELPIEEE